MRKPNVNTVESDRRTFLKSTAAGGLAGMAALAGCTGNQDDSEQSQTTTQNEQEGEQQNNQVQGKKLPTYQYYNNPANYDPARHDGINLMARQMQKLGLDVKVQVFEWGTLLDKVFVQHDYGIATWNHSLKDEPGVRLPGMFHSENAAEGGGNWAGYKNSDLDPKLLQQLQVDGDERKQLLYDIQDVLAEDAPMIPAVHTMDLITYNTNNVSGWVNSPKGYNYYENMMNIKVTNGRNELRGTWPETIGSLNPLGTTSKSYKTEYNLLLMYDPLVRLNREYKPDPKLSLATEWNRPDQKSVEYTLRTGQKWHDGEDFTAEDVEFTLNYIKENKVSTYESQWSLIDTVERNGNTVRVNFTESVGPVHSVFSNQMHILPKHIWQDIDNPEQANIKEPVGTGAFQLDYWDEGSELSLKRFDGHWNTPNFEKRIWRIIPETSTVWELLKQGQLDYIPQTQVGRQLVENEKTEQIAVKSSPSDATWHVTPNNRLPGFDDPAVRQAIHHSIPKKAIVNQLLYGYGKEGWNLITKVFGEFSNTDVKRYEEGLKPARQRLKDAGYTWDNNDMLHFPAE